jgi:V/A-type H+/Na+-transporting ATPase subunit I
MKPERMAHITILCKNEAAQEIVEKLAQWRALHIIDHAKGQVGSTVIDIGSPLPDAERLSAAQLKARSLLAKIPPGQTHHAFTAHLDERIEIIDELARRYAQHEETIAQADEALQRIGHQEQVLRMLPEVELAALHKTKAAQAILTKAPQQVIAQIPSLATEKKNDATLVIVAAKDASRAKEMLGATMVDLSPVATLRGPTSGALRALGEERMVQASVREQELRAQRSFREHYVFLKECEQELAIALLKAQAPLHFGRTRRMTLIQGFLPHSRTALLGQLPQPVLVDIGPAHDAPVLLSNPPVANSFEQLLRLYALPKYDEIDPTTLMAFTFPLFFGFMLGDIGYGLVAFVAFSLLRWLKPSVRSVANILMLSALSSIIFGMLFGEFFGGETILGVHLTPVLHRTESILSMMGIAAAIGAVHVNFGLVLGMINEARVGLIHALLSKGSWIMLQIGALLLAASYGLLTHVPLLSNITATKPVAYAVVAAAIVGIAYAEGIRGVIELPMIFSNILSYVRLVAIGLASVYMASVVNQLAEGLFDKGGPWIAAALLLLLLGHTINLLLGLLGPFLHSLRLHYVEFFGKFYEGGGQAYRPFGEVEAQ